MTKLVIEISLQDGGRKAPDPFLATLAQLAPLLVSLVRPPPCECEDPEPEHGEPEPAPGTPEYQDLIRRANAAAGTPPAGGR